MCATAADFRLRVGCGRRAPAASRYALLSALRTHQTKQAANPAGLDVKTTLIAKTNENELLGAVQSLSKFGFQLLERFLEYFREAVFD